MAWQAGASKDFAICARSTRERALQILNPAAPTMPAFHSGRRLVNLKPLPLLGLKSIPPEEPRLHMNPDGSLRIGRSDGQIEFAFRHLNLRFTANTRPTASGTVLQLAAAVGPVPYSAEGVALRRSAFAVIEASQMLADARLVVSQHRSIYCIGKAALPSDWHPVDVLSASVRLILAVKPYLTLLGEMLPAGAAVRH
jgi:hypothetical protein